VFVDALEEGIQHGLVKAPVIVDPTTHDAVDHLCEVVDTEIAAAADSPGTYLPAMAIMASQLYFS
jgi:hypothetical protein